MNSTDLQSALSAFLAANPDLPAGSDEVADKEAAGPGKRQTQRLDVVLEKKGRGGKQATIICGFEGSDDELLELASTLKKKLATGGSARGGEILIQGDCRADVVRILQVMGYKSRII